MQHATPNAAVNTTFPATATPKQPNRRFRRMIERGVFRMDTLGTVYVVSKHNTARALRFKARLANRRNKKD